MNRSSTGTDRQPRTVPVISLGMGLCNSLAASRHGYAITVWTAGSFALRIDVYVKGILLSFPAVWTQSDTSLAYLQMLFFTVGLCTAPSPSIRITLPDSRLT